MSDQSIFMDKTAIPISTELEEALGSTYPLWQKVVSLTYAAYPGGLEEWNYPGKNYGWSFRIKDKRRAILYLLPREGFFKVGMVFGDKALDNILASTINNKIKTDLQAARKYAEGRGVHIDINTATDMNDIPKLIEIKLAH